MYGYQESGDLTPGKQGGKFGLNTGAFITKFELNENAGKDGAAADAIDFTVQVGEREFRHRFFPISKVFAKGGGEITDTNSEEYKKAMASEVAQFNAVISDIVKVFVSEEDLKLALQVPIPTFKDFAKIVTRLVQATPNWQKKPVDVFLQYQWAPSGDNDKTYLELPKNVKQGVFIVPSEGVCSVAMVRGTRSVSQIDAAPGAIFPRTRRPSRGLKCSAVAPVSEAPSADP